ncbi:MAG TPA: ASKHA domain-containing protein [Planctomycetota bacterium]|jgi:uncharacterized 2Fe-2S/4Fe-4S cluster protein (DUF4445 family)
MPSITFLPKNITVNVEAGTSLLDAATAAGITIEAPCGGEGSCGECRVRVESGAASAIEHALCGSLTRQEQADGWVLACSSRVTGDLTVRVPGKIRVSAQIVTESIGSFGGTAPQEVPTPPAFKVRLEVEAPSAGDSRSDFERLASALATSSAGWEPGQLRAEDVACTLEVLRKLPTVLRSGETCVTVTLANAKATDARPQTQIINVQPGDWSAQSYGLAIDVGTTTCAVQLVDLRSGHLLGTASDYNGQISRGPDVISRINYACGAARLEELQSLVLHSLNTLVRSLCESHSVFPRDVISAAIAGNPTMMHLLLGIEPEHIRLDPYTPAINRVPDLKAGEIGLQINAAAPVVFAPGIGSYVGGDITAGLLQTPLATHGETLRLFIDIGTNGEIVIGDGQWLMACACSAGPAFEGSGISCGMRAAPGAIERVRIDRGSAQAQFSVIGGGKPRGLCGSGLIDLLAELWGAGILDPSGKLVAQNAPCRVRPNVNSSRNLEYVVVPQAESATGGDIVFSEQDAQNLLRTKAAVYAAIALMLKSVGHSCEDIAEVYVAGGFGRFLDLRKSVSIGLLPDLPLERFQYLGNASLAGARALLTHAAARRQIHELASRITYLELNVDPAYMDEYTAALFLPHTDARRFPSVGT